MLPPLSVVRGEQLSKHARRRRSASHGHRSNPRSDLINGSASPVRRSGPGRLAAVLPVL